MARRGRKGGKRRGPHPYRALTPGSLWNLEPGRHSDGNGLHLLVEKSGCRRWVQRLTIDGIRCDLSLGPLRCVTLAQARKKALENLRIIDEGGDPRKLRQKFHVPTLEEAVESVIETDRPTWKTKSPEEEIRRLFTKNTYPTIPGNTPINKIKLEDVVRVLSPIWGKRRSRGYTLYQKLSKVMRAADAMGVDHGYRVPDLAARAKDLMPRVKNKPVQHASLPWRHAPAAVKNMLASDADRLVQLFVVFTMLTAARFSEAANATRSEIGEIEGHPAWLLASERMKGDEDHSVPLARQTQEVLETASRLNPGSKYFFWKRGRPVPRREVTALLRSLELVSERGRPATMHGFRATFRDWGRDKATTEVLESALAHAPSNATVKAYMRSDLFDVRAPLMQDYADFLLPNGLS